MKGRKAAPQPPSDEAALARCPAPPRWLSPYAKAEWRRQAPDLYRRRLLGVDTLGVLETYCTAYGMLRSYHERLAADGIMTEGAEGKPNQAAKMILAAAREVRLYAAELGLGPHRRGVRGAGTPKPDEKGGDDDAWDPSLLA
ncbi:P27 family predicted phage terminase small subunit [Constrictibacter sp. MBR-5]|jgi:P27 family predicted phage terminase small subunit|uniref:phage terminase small subunit P27 family n=1 Tax=Constrictibacter sp. MBR-5 TaxID=3156467 RepID=UPI00339AA9B9